MASPSPLTPRLHQLAAEVAATTRVLVMEEILDYSGHVSVRLPGEDALLIQPGDYSRAELSPEAVLLVGFDGNVREGNGKPPSELAIHVETYKARPDVQAVLHCHMEIAIAFTMLEGVTLQPMRSQAIRWASGIPTHPDPGHIRYTAQGQALARTLGPHQAALMRAHGLLLVPESVRGLLVDAVHFKENARAHMQALQAGCRPLPLTADEMKLISHKEFRTSHVSKLWNYYVRKGVKDGVLPGAWPLLAAA